MYVLPKAKASFSKTTYWNSFFEKRGDNPFEWYGNYKELSTILHKYIKVNDTILVAGCGNSTLSADMYDAGYLNIVNVDTSDIVVKQMRNMYSTSRRGLLYEIMDVTNTSFSDNSFNCVIDKGTLDALFPDKSDSSKERVILYFNEFTRILKPFGRFICFSLLQDYILNYLLDYFDGKPWLIRISRCCDVEKNRTDGSCLPVFVVVLTKIKSGPFFVELSTDNVTFVKTNKEDVKSSILSIQKTEIICNGLTRTNLSECGGEAVIEIIRPQDETPRFSIIVKDKVSSVKKYRPKEMRFAAFIVPKGREMEYLFSSSEGREDLLDACEVDRLAIVYLQAEHEYPTSPKEIQAELELPILKLAPSTLQNVKIPFLALGEDVIAEDNKVLAGSSKFSGDYVVVDVEDKNNQFFRRLIFLNKRKLIQSEMKLKIVNEEGIPKKVIDFQYIVNDYHIHIFTGIALVCNARERKPTNALLLGLGGGVLSHYINLLFNEVYLDVVELDPEIVTVAEKCFELQKSEKLHIIVDDGLEYLKEIEKYGEIKYDIIIFDVDNKDISSPVSCPPVEFLDPSVLKSVKTSLTERGVFIMNLSCRSTQCRLKITNDVKQNFDNLAAMKMLGEDLNEVFLCWQADAAYHISDLKKAANAVKTRVQQHTLNAKMELLDMKNIMQWIKS